jgi:lysophospholipid acyltransferase (LPLAT)-like uncharacterized protein
VGRRRKFKKLKQFKRKFIYPVLWVTLYPIFGLLVGLGMRLAQATVRVTYLHDEGQRPDLALLAQGRNIVYTFWHGRQFLLFRLLRPAHCQVMTSLGSAGEVQCWVLRVFGYSPVRGSSSRGGAAGLINMIKRVKTGKNAAFAVDGPSGPAYEPKPGAVQVAGKGEALLLPVSVAFRSFKFFARWWDEYHLPVPFTRAIVKFGQPRELPSRLDDDLITRTSDELKQELNLLTAEVDAYFRPDKGPRG